MPRRRQSGLLAKTWSGDYDSGLSRLRLDSREYDHLRCALKRVSGISEGRCGGAGLLRTAEAHDIPTRATMGRDGLGLRAPWRGCSRSARVGQQPAHLCADGATRETASLRATSAGELAAAEPARTGTALVGERRVDADASASGRDASRSLQGSGCGSVLARWIFLAMASASSNMLMRDMSEGLTSTSSGAVAQA